MPEEDLAPAGAPLVVLGIDVGVSKSVVTVAAAGATSFGADLVPNESSNVVTPTVVGFSAHERHVGDVAQAQLTTSAQQAVAGLLPLLGRDAAAAGAADPFARCALVDGPAGVAARVRYADAERDVAAEQLVAMLLARLALHAARARPAAGVRRSVLCHPAALSPRAQRALLDAAHIAGLPSPSLVPSHAAAASCFGVKRPVREGEPPRRVAFVDVGQRYTSAAVYTFAHRAAPALMHAGGCELGAADLDGALWALLAAELASAHATPVTRASRAGARLLAEVAKAKRTLSTVAQASVELECFGPAEKDIRLPVTRERFEAACAPLRERLEAFLRSVLAAGDAPPAAVEVIGGGARVPWVAAAIAASAGDAPLSHMLDGASACALGAAYIAQAHPDDRAFPAAFPPPVVLPSSGDELPPGLSPEQRAAFRAAEQEMAAADAAAVALADAWNALEAYVLEMRGAATSGPLAGELQPARSLPLLAEAEEWMNAARDDGDAVPLAVVTGRLDALRAALQEIAPGYFAKLAAQKAALEAELSAANAARQAEATHEDHDSRPLRKAERLRLALNNKEEGTQLFKDGNLAPAVARWTRALEHTNKFIDLTPEDEPEIDALRVSLHLNIAMALLRTGGDAALRRAVEAATAALRIEPANAKALYRRAAAYRDLKQLSEAKADLVAAAAAEPGDKAVATLARAVDAAIAAQTAREKAVYSKMFG